MFSDILFWHNFLISAIALTSHYFILHHKAQMDITQSSKLSSSFKGLVPLCPLTNISDT